MESLWFLFQYLQYRETGQARHNRRLCFISMAFSTFSLVVIRIGLFFGIFMFGFNPVTAYS